MTFQLIDQFGVVQILPATFLVLLVLCPMASFSMVRRTKKLSVSRKDQLIYLSTLLPTFWIIPVWLGLLSFYPRFFRLHALLSIAPIYLYIAALLFWSKRNKEVIVRIKKATDESTTEEQKQRARRNGRRFFWVFVALSVLAFVALLRWRP